MTRRDFYNELNKAFGVATIHSWPVILEEAPRWWHFNCRRRERRIHEALQRVGLRPITQADRHAYWAQIRVGQGVYEDAGSFLWRAWSAALGLPFEEPHLTYRGLIAREFGEAS